MPNPLRGWVMTRLLALCLSKESLASENRSDISPTLHSRVRAWAEHQFPLAATKGSHRLDNSALGFVAIQYNITKGDGVGLALARLNRRSRCCLDKCRSRRLCLVLLRLRRSLVRVRSSQGCLEFSDLSLEVVYDDPLDSCHVMYLRVIRCLGRLGCRWESGTMLWARLPPTMRNKLRGLSTSVKAKAIDTIALARRS